MAADSAVYVVLINASGNLIQRSVNFNPVQGSLNIENAIKSGQKVVGIWVVRDLNGDTGGPWWDEYSGNSQYMVAGNFDGIQVCRRDITGATQGVRRKCYFSDGADPTASEVVAAKLEDSTMGQGANWPVLDDGQGSYYVQKLAAARTLVGAPGA